MHLCSSPIQRSMCMHLSQGSHINGSASHFNGAQQHITLKQCTVVALHQVIYNIVPLFVVRSLEKFHPLQCWVKLIVQY